MVKLLKPKARAPSEHRIQEEIRKRLGQEPGLTLWRNAKYQGRVREMQPGSSLEVERYVNAGLQPDGSSDLIGIMRPIGRWFVLEVKDEGRIPTLSYLEGLEAKARAGVELSKSQRHDLNQWLYIQLIRESGGFAQYVDSVESAVKALDRARKGETS